MHGPDNHYILQYSECGGRAQHSTCYFADCVEPINDMHEAGVGAACQSTHPEIDAAVEKRWAEVRRNVMLSKAYSTHSTRAY
jgi:hypothetical protein